MAIENTDQAIKPQMTEEQKEQAEKLIAAQPKFIKKVAKENKARRERAHKAKAAKAEGEGKSAKRERKAAKTKTLAAAIKASGGKHIDMNRAGKIEVVNAIKRVRKAHPDWSLHDLGEKIGFNYWGLRCAENEKRPQSTLSLAVLAKLEKLAD